MQSHGRSKKTMWTLLSCGGGLFFLTSGFVIKIFSLVTFTVLHISLASIKGYFDWQRLSHVTFSPRYFVFYSLVVKFSVSLKISIVTLT